jgi:hypothetical protein
MKIPGYRYLVDVSFVKLRERIPSLFECGITDFTKISFSNGMLVQNIDSEYFYIKESENSEPTAYTYEDMLGNATLRNILNYFLVWINKGDYDGSVIATTVRPDVFFIVDCGASCKTILIRDIEEYFNVSGKAVEPILLYTMPLITKQREFLRV